MLPVATLIRPLDLAGVSNGQLPQSLLRSVWDGTQRDDLHHLAARAWVALVAAAERDGIRLRFTDCYRPYDAQERLFLARYTTTPLPGRPTKRWRNQTWWLRPGVATAATPGSSNHGWGLAVDVSEELDGDPADESVSARTVQWLVAHASRYGWSAELQSEPWHWRYVAGDNVPAAVIEHELGDTPEVDMATVDVEVITDAVGNGYKDLPSHIKASQVIALTPLVRYPPESGAFGYGSAECGLSESSQGVAAVNVKGWWPANRLSVRVAYTPA